MVDNADDGVKYVTKTDSSIFVLVDEDTCNQELAVKLQDEVYLEAKNGDVARISESMAKDE